MEPTTLAGRGGWRVIATSVRPVSHINLAAVAAGGGVVRNERIRPEAPVQMWVDEHTVPGLDVAIGRMIRDEEQAGGFYAHELRYPSREAALAALPLLVACNAPVRDGVKRLKVVDA